MQSSAIIRRVRLQFERSSAARYSAAVVAVLLALVLRIIAHTMTGGTLSIYQTFYLAAFFVAWLCGIGPSIVAITLSCLAALLFVYQWYDLETILQPIYLFELALYVFVSGALAYVIEREKSARLRADYRRSAVEHMVEQLTRLRREYEQTIRQVDRQSAYMETVLRQLPVGVVIAAIDGSYHSLNRRAEELLGRPPTPAEIAEGKVHRMVDLETRQTIPMSDYPLMRAMRGETPPTIQVEATRTDGEKHFLSISATPIFDIRGELIAAVSVFSDIAPEIQLRQQLETALEELETVLRQLPVGVAIVSADGSISSVNHRAEELLGRPVTPAEGQSHSYYRMKSLDSGEMIPVENYPLMRALRGEVAQDVRVEVTKVDGQKHLLSINATPVYNSKGAQIAAVKVIVDMEPELHMRQQLETALEETDRERRRLQAVLDILPVGVVVAAQSGEMVYVNPGAYHIWGENAPAAETTAGYSAYKAWSVDTGELMTAETWALSRALERGETTQNEILRIERFDNTQATMINSAAPIRDADGEIIGAVACHTDITELYQYQEALQHSEIRYRSLWNAGFDARIAHKDGVIVDINEAYTRILGFTREDVINQNGTPILARPEDVATARRIAAEESDAPYDVMLKRKDGTLIYVTARSINVPLPDGALRLTTIRDISELKAAEAERAALLQQETRRQALRDFVSEFSHDFKTPLTVINTNSHLLQRITKTEDDLARVRVIQEQVERMAHMVDDLITLVKTDPP
jgi:PAS domain S-box-containing protein